MTQQNRPIGRGAVLALALLACTAGPVTAQSDAPISADQIEQSLGTTPGARALNRIIRMEIPTAPGSTAAPEVIQVDADRSIDLTVNFRYNSADLTDEAKSQLNKLGQVLVRAPGVQDDNFLIAGHTDATGSDAYNLGLSERRAAAVKTYLTEVFGLRTDRLRAKGFGEYRLLAPERPTDAVNRRVQIIAIVN